MITNDLTCQAFVELVTDYLELALTPAERHAFEAHLADCEHCATYVEQIRQTIALSERLRPPTLDEAVRGVLVRMFREMGGG